MGAAALLWSLGWMQAQAGGAAAPSQPSQTAEVVAAKTEATNARADAERLNYELMRQQNQSAWTLIITLLGGTGGAITLAKGYAAWRIQQQKTASDNDIAKINAEAALAAANAKATIDQQVALAKVTLDAKKADDGAAFAALKDRFDLLQKQCERDSLAYREDRKLMGEHIARAEAKIEALETQADRQERRISYYQLTAREFPFGTWASGRDQIVMAVSGNADRNLLMPMGLDRQQLENHNEDDVWPPPLRKAILTLREAAAKMPGHCATMVGVQVHDNVPPLIISKMVGQYPDGAAWGVQTIVIPMTSVIPTPDDLKPGYKGPPLPPAASAS